VKGNLFYLKPKKGIDYIAKKLALFSRNKECKFGCFNSLDMAGREGQTMIVEWIKERIGLSD
jgi:hypothetical protein